MGLLISRASEPSFICGIDFGTKSEKKPFPYPIIAKRQEIKLTYPQKMGVTAFFTYNTVRYSTCRKVIERISDTIVLS